ncbi:hypothetical protein RFI_31570 [Reticulomyxa filosa]|uniref:Uncharacterized protein n=1 Tax=Reticulomyxa filosa TaxID=46433 RepID=X6LWT9_RETFI|nr:hypothetical protein RFI_31570 [Reticulomyxa filosa]|eukprot:ETO05826.1 hypothetical protein RFI_31570 [Reticulomyxa filosa]
MAERTIEANYNMNADDEETEASIDFKINGRNAIDKSTDQEIKEACEKYWIENDRNRKEEFEEEDLEYLNALKETNIIQNMKHIDTLQEWKKK